MIRNPDEGAWPVAYDRLANWYELASQIGKDPDVRADQLGARDDFFWPFLAAGLLGALIEAVGEKKASQVVARLEDEASDGGTAMSRIADELTALDIVDAATRSGRSAAK